MNSPCLFLLLTPMTSIGFLLSVYNLYFFVYFVFSCIVLPFWRNKVYIISNKRDTLYHKLGEGDDNLV